MGNNKLIKNISLAMMIFISIVGISVLYWLYTIFYSQGPVVEDNSKVTTINYDLYQKIGETKIYGVKVTPDEPGYGRANPFAPYKAPPAPVAAPTAASGSTAVAPTTPAQ